MEGTSVTSIEVANSIPANYIGPPNRGDLSAFLGRVGHPKPKSQTIHSETASVHSTEDVIGV